VNASELIVRNGTSILNFSFSFEKDLRAGVGEGEEEVS